MRRRRCVQGNTVWIKSARKRGASTVLATETGPEPVGSGFVIPRSGAVGLHPDGKGFGGENVGVGEGIYRQGVVEDGIAFGDLLVKADQARQILPLFIGLPLGDGVLLGVAQAGLSGDVQAHAGNGAAAFQDGSGGLRVAENVPFRAGPGEAAAHQENAAQAFHGRGVLADSSGYIGQGPDGDQGQLFSIGPGHVQDKVDGSCAAVGVGVVQGLVFRLLQVRGVLAEVAEIDAAAALNSGVDGNVRSAPEVQELFGDPAPLLRVVKGCGNAQEPEPRFRDAKGQGQSVVDVVADVGVQDEFARFHGESLLMGGSLVLSYAFWMEKSRRQKRFLYAK